MRGLRRRRGLQRVRRLINSAACALFASAALYVPASCAGQKPSGGVLEVLAVGDSITAGGYPAELMRLFSESGSEARVFNLGVPGATVSSYSRLIDRYRTLFRRFEPRIVLLLLGANDAREGAGYEGADEFISGMEALIAVLREEVYPENPPEVLVSSVLPVRPGKSMFTEESLRIIKEEMNPAIAALARKENVRFVDNFTLFHETPELLPDGVHPCSEGDAKLAGNWFEAVRGILDGRGTPATGIVYGEMFLMHDTGPGHPERAERLMAVMDKLERENMLGRLRVIGPEKAPLEWIERIHCGDYIEKVRKACAQGAPFMHSPDTPVSKHSYDAALHAAGGVLKAVDLVMEGRLKNAFCAVRPPGHHALRNRAMGFCLFNNIAIGAKYLLDEYGFERVAIVDWDVHHGNATQDMFYDTPEVLYISIHQHPLFPGTGNADEKGSGKGYGYNLNIPLEAGAGDEQYMAVFKKEIIPALKEFRPEFILISAGFDAHADDPLGGMEVTGEGFAGMTKMLKRVAEEFCGGRIVSVLEGGYSPEGLPDSVYEHLKVLMN